MNVDLNRAYDSFFGPPSDPISIRQFLDETNCALPTLTAQDILNHAGWRQLSEDERRAVEAECSGGVSEVKATVEDVWNNPMLSAHLYRAHDAALASVLGRAEGSAPRGRKRKHASSAHEEPPEVRALQEKLDSISLRCWGFSEESGLFMRSSKNSDFNALRVIKKSGWGSLPLNHGGSASSQGDLAPTAQTHPPGVALITLTVYNRVPWVQSYLTRHSQHAVLSSQTLLDFVRVIPCDSSEMPAEEVDEDGNVVGYAYKEGNEGHAVDTSEEGCLLLIEDVVYGDGRPGADYADKLLSTLQNLPEQERPRIIPSPTSLAQTVFDTLTLRINQPYWMLHQGNCEHFIVVDQIRLSHPADPRSGYPLTLHVTPTLSELCKACSRVPAVLAILGDIRLGESPCLLCAPCWRIMGPPKKTNNGAGEEDEVTVIPLVRKKRVWSDGEQW